MKKALWIASVCFSLIAFSSCLSTSASAKDVEKEPAAGPVASVTSDQAVPAASDAPAATPAPDNPVVSDASVEPVAESAPVESAEPVESAGPVERPAVSGIDDVIPPPAEKLLYFYPEPDPLYIAPIAPEPVTETVATAPKPAASPVPVPAAPKASETKATSKSPAAKTSADTTVISGDAREKESVADVLPGIWTAETVTPAAVPETAKKNAEPSRSVQIAEGQSLEVWYPGSGWVYLGDASAQNGLEYQTRKLDKTDTLFTFRAVKAGSYLLEFTRFDVLEDSFASDTLSVSVYVPDAKKTGKVRAPDYRASSTGSVARTASDGGTAALASTGSQANAASAGTGTPNASSARVSGISDEPTLVSAAASGSSTANAALNPAVSASALLESARKSLSSGDVPAALASLETFFSIAVDSIDEGIFLKGQAYEANSSSRDIRKALDAYETLVKSWPDSGRWYDADARIRYIRQFYLGR